MHPILRNILAVVAGLVVGSAVNMGLLMGIMQIIPFPEGVIMMDPESLQENIGRFEVKHFIAPFLAHSLGTLAGAWVASLIAATRKMTFALVIGFVFLAAGIYNVISIPAPMWFNALDLIAYLPAAWIGGKLGTRK